MQNINKEWHKNHKIPENPTFEQRINWHLEHHKHCRCRPIPIPLLEKIIGLNQFEKNVILLCLAKEIEQDLENLYAYVENNVNATHHTIAKKIVNIKKKQKKFLKAWDKQVD